jgi:hypothetical protein
MMGADSSWECEDAEQTAELNGADRGYRAALDRDLAAPWFVWGIWSLMLLGSLVLALWFANPFPLSDELDLLSEYIQGTRMSIDPSPGKSIDQNSHPGISHGGMAWWL